MVLTKLNPPPHLIHYTVFTQLSQCLYRAAHQTHPKRIFLVLGPCGVGKTYVATRAGTRHGLRGTAFSCARLDTTKTQRELSTRLQAATRTVEGKPRSDVLSYFTPTPPLSSPHRRGKRNFVLIDDLQAPSSTHVTDVWCHSRHLIAIARNSRVPIIFCSNDSQCARVKALRRSKALKRHLTVLYLNAPPPHMVMPLVQRRHATWWTRATQVQRHHVRDLVTHVLSTSKGDIRHTLLQVQWSLTRDTFVMPVKHAYQRQYGFNFQERLALALNGFQSKTLKHDAIFNHMSNDDIAFLTHVVARNATKLVRDDATGYIAFARMMDAQSSLDVYQSRTMQSASLTMAYGALNDFKRVTLATMATQSQVHKPASVMYGHVSVPKNSVLAPSKPPSPFDVARQRHWSTWTLPKADSVLSSLQKIPKQRRVMQRKRPQSKRTAKSVSKRVKVTPLLPVCTPP